MYGVEFKEANNSLIVVSAVFQVLSRGQQESPVYKLTSGPNGTRIEKEAILDDGEWGWKVVHQNATSQDIEALLPHSTQYGMSWTYTDFMIALTFFGEGYKRGYNTGEQTANDRHYRREKQKSP